MWITSHNHQPPGRGQETSNPFQVLFLSLPVPFPLKSLSYSSALTCISVFCPRRRKATEGLSRQRVVVQMQGSETGGVQVPALSHLLAPLLWANFLTSLSLTFVAGEHQVLPCRFCEHSMSTSEPAFPVHHVAIIFDVSQGHTPPVFTATS